MTLLGRQLALCLCLAALPAWAATSPAMAVATIVDGDALLIRQATKFKLAEGVRLLSDDIVETAAGSRLLRIEFSDGVMLDLGPESLALLAPQLGGERAHAALKAHLLQGVAKLSLPPSLEGSAAALSSPLLDVNAVARSAVFVLLPDAAEAFAESGELVLRERRAGRAGASLTLKRGDFYSRSGDAKASVSASPSPAFVQRLPRPFRDTLPSRAGLFAAREVVAKPLGEISFTEAEPWIDAEGLSGVFTGRWQALAQNSEFRAGLLGKLRAHPEWDRVLYPEKYRPAPLRYGSKQ